MRWIVLAYTRIAEHRTVSSEFGVTFGSIPFVVTAIGAPVVGLSVPLARRHGEHRRLTVLVTDSYRLLAPRHLAARFRR